MHGRLEHFDTHVQHALDAMIARGPGLACFDADHTLYCHDAGEGFYEHLIGAGLIADELAAYRALEATDHIAAYERLATRMAGLLDADLRERARAYFAEAFVPNIYPAMRRLIADMLAARWDVRLVSASPRWPIQAAAPHFGLTPDHVVALDVHVIDGRLTEMLAFELPYAAGKVTAIDRFIKQRPRFAAGDSAGDRWMLDLATDTALVLRYPDYPGQKPLLDRAAEAGWLVQAVTV